MLIKLSTNAKARYLRVRRMNINMMKTGFIRQSIRSFDVRLLLAIFSRKIIKKSNSLMSLLKNKSEISSPVIIRNALILCGNVFPANISPTPAIATFSTSSRSEHDINILTHSTNEIRVRIPPNRTRKFLNLSGRTHNTSIAEQKSYWSAVNIVNVYPIGCVNLLASSIMVIIVS